MNKPELLEKYYKDEDKLLIAKIIDKINFSKTRNKIEHTDFLDMYQRKICENVLNAAKANYYVFYGGFENSDKNMLIIYPEKLQTIFQNGNFNYNTIMSAIKITLPNELKGKYSYKDYLSGLMKIGIKREKFGDILVNDYGAYIIISKTLEKYIIENLNELTRFSKSKIELIDISDIEIPKAKFEQRTITVPAMRLDSIVGELANISRTMANEIIEQERVFVNYENETRKSKEINENDIIVIRGKGKFKIVKINGITRKGKNSILIEHYL